MICVWDNNICPLQIADQPIGAYCDGLAEREVLYRDSAPDLLCSDELLSLPSKAGTLAHNRTITRKSPYSTGGQEACYSMVAYRHPTASEEGSVPKHNCRVL